MNFKNLNFYTKTIMTLNLVAAFFITVYLWSGWDLQVNNYCNLSTIWELVLYLSVLPVFYLWTKKIIKAVENKQTAEKIIIVAILFYGLGLFGAGMHFGANQIRSTIDAPIVYFYDEILSHRLTWIGLIGLGFFLANLQLLAPNKQKFTQLDHFIILLSSLFQAIVSTLGTLEGNSGKTAFFFLFFALPVLLIRLRNKKVAKFPLSFFYKYCYLVSFILLSIWFFINKGLTEPSQVGIGRF